MKYISNTGRYARAYEIEKGSQKLNIILERRRLFRDTGNVAMTGITAVEDEDYELLKKNKAFIRDFKDKDFGLALIDESKARGEPDKRASELAEENKKLKEALAEAKKKADANKDNEAVKAIKDENAKLKAQLEALTKGKATEPADEKADDEGF